MTIRALALACVAAAAVVLGTAGCTPQHDVDPNGRCLSWQLAVKADVHPSSTSTSPSWDLTFTNTSTSACVFGGVPSVRFRGATSKISAGVVQRAVSEEWAIQLATGDTAYANIALDPASPAACTPVQVHTLAVVAPHVAGGGFVVKVPAKFMGCSGTQKVAHVGQVTAKRSK
jgi:Protein of unknown function (DUF4232)